MFTLDLAQIGLSEGNLNALFALTAILLGFAILLFMILTINKIFG